MIELSIRSIKLKVNNLFLQMFPHVWLLLIRDNNGGEFLNILGSDLFLFCLTLSGVIIPDGSCESRQSYLVIEELEQGD